MFGRFSNGGSKPRTRNMQLLFSYLPDWIVTCGLAAAFFALDKIDGFRREFSLTDTTIQHTYTVHERVPNWMLIAICFGVPVVIMPIVNMLTVRSWWDWHNSMLGLVLGLATTGAVTQVVKVTVGRPRPDAIARCKPKADAHDSAVFGLVTTIICTETDIHMMKDGWRSFFSGHSSLSFAGLGFLSFYLAGKLHLFDERGHTGKAWIALTPLTGALLIAISRTMDYRHHWQDVLVGSTVGLIFSYFAYRQYYPTLESPFSHKPYSPRIPREDAYRDSTLPFTRSDDDHSTPGHGAAYRRFSLGKGSSAGHGSAGNAPYGGANNYAGSQHAHAYPPIASSSEVRLRAPDDDEVTVGGAASPPKAGRRLSADEPLVGYERGRV
ncbi:putative diacylglycerol pyrophosphate phosphatase 1 Short=DGPP phosphatase [Rhizoctonia solani AG-1 IB]|uniref:Putative diacylglycerol pyrophosphate phosphatase 1 Short=DGPP phosphatase n=1 Tax=Thanatephorus cucumeris (strain AG1-IB / isolate 7/3/14) TaxID=1108050 RepID=M5C861_THACB|nr:putative diacylglycerol pyrophosphate phosphatase 1 Short=DGPP phosphatase [Rhizoctonia solani AG-1 IB]